jgi:DNA-binding MarR family transcriptional regulator
MICIHDTSPQERNRSMKTRPLSETDSPLTISPGDAWSHEALKRFRLIFGAVQHHSKWVEQRCGITSAQLWAIAELSHRPGLRVSELATAMCVHPSTASNLLDKLERKGLVKKERQSQDQRVVRLTLTEQGRKTLADAPHPTRGILQNALFTLPEDVLKSLVADLDALVAAMNLSDQKAEMQPIGAMPLSQPPGEPIDMG